MGHSLSIAAGIAVAKPNRQIICLDGDGAAIMHLGSLPVTACLNLPNLLHIILNNGAHDSVGAQPTVGFDANLTEIAKAAGFKTLRSPAKNLNHLKEGIYTLLKYKKAGFIYLHIRKGIRPDMPPLNVNLKQEKIDLMRHINDVDFSCIDK